MTGGPLLGQLLSELLSNRAGAPGNWLECSAEEAGDWGFRLSPISTTQAQAQSGLGFVFL